MKFSVLMSVYKNDNPVYFEQSLRSVSVQQTLKPDQIVIIKDGPVSAKIDEIISDYKNLARDVDFTVLSLQKNVGLAKALNIGLKECKNEWIARMDADDISVPKRFEVQFDFLKNNPEIGVLGSVIEEFTCESGDKKSLRVVPNNHDDIVKMAHFRNPMNHVTIVYKKEYVNAVNGYNEDCGKLEDYRLWIDLMLKGVIFANIADTLVYVRVGNGFIERRSDKREIADWNNLQVYLEKKNFINKWEGLMNRISIRIFIYTPISLKKILYKYVLRK